jgi:phosphoglycerate dehydrogenase-like enzyme
VSAPGTSLVISVPDALVRATLGELPSDVEVVEWDMSAPAPRSHFDIVVPSYLQSWANLANLDGLDVGLVQCLTLGYDGVAEFLPTNMVFANAASVHETSTAEMTMALILASQRHIPDFVRAAAAGTWSPSWNPSLADRTVLLVGYGGVGRAIEARLMPFETTILRLARHERSDERGRIYGLDALHELLPGCDVVVVAVPLDEDTHHFVDAAFLSSMPDGSLLVNVSRGAVADTDALLAEARSGRIRLALDVTDPEPLPDGHPLFALANVLISPHVAGMSSAALPRITRLLHEQMERMRHGEEPLNVVLRT